MPNRGKKLGSGTGQSGHKNSTAFMETAAVIVTGILGGLTLVLVVLDTPEHAARATAVFVVVAILDILYNLRNLRKP